MTVGVFQEWHKIMTTEKDVLVREYKLLSLVTGKSVDELEAMKRGDIRKLFAEMGKMQRMPISGEVNQAIAIGWKPFVCFTDLSEFSNELTTNQGTALKEWTKTEQSTIENMHRCLAMLYVPYRPFKKKTLPSNIEKAAEIFKKAKIGQIYGTLFFYSRVSEKLQIVFLNSSNEASRIITEHLKEITLGVSSQRGTDGII